MHATGDAPTVQDLASNGHITGLNLISSAVSSSNLPIWDLQADYHFISIMSHCSTQGCRPSFLWLTVLYPTLVLSSTRTGTCSTGAGLSIWFLADAPFLLLRPRRIINTTADGWTIWLVLMPAIGNVFDIKITRTLTSSIQIGEALYRKGQRQPPRFEQFVLHRVL